MAEWIKKKKKDLHRCSLQQTYFQSKDTHRLKAEEWKKIFPTKRTEAKLQQPILVPGETHFKTKAAVRNKGRRYTGKGINPTRTKHLETFMQPTQEHLNTERKH